VVAAIPTESNSNAFVGTKSPREIGATVGKETGKQIPLSQTLNDVSWPEGALWSDSIYNAPRDAPDVDWPTGVVTDGNVMHARGDKNEIFEASADAKRRRNKRPGAAVGESFPVEIKSGKLKRCSSKRCSCSRLDQQRPMAVYEETLKRRMFVPAYCSFEIEGSKRPRDSETGVLHPLPKRAQSAVSAQPQ
jgi:hypothetical protein